jgi:hypothetical protein
MSSTFIRSAILSATGAVASVGQAAPTFVNGLAISGGTVDVSGGLTANNGRVGFFSDIFYDKRRSQWWGESDRGPGGGALDYSTRLQRFDLRIDPVSGAISDFAVLETVIFKDENGVPLDGRAPSPTNVLGNAFDPEGIVIDKRGHFFASDEYGPSLYEFDRTGKRVAIFATPANLVPRNISTGTPNYAADPTPASDAAGKRTNRGFEGLAITPNEKFVYAMLQSAMLDEGTDGGVCNRIVKFSTSTRQAVAQFAYRMETSAQGRGISALWALGDKDFLVLERNNRGIGVGATLSPPMKLVYRISVANAVDVSGIALSNANCATYAVPKTGPFLNLAANTLADIGNHVPEKWEGLAVGPQLADGSFMMLAGTDNDYSVTQNPSGTQYDVYFRFSDANPFPASIQCPLDTTVNCFTTASAIDGDGYTTTTPIALPTDGTYELMRGVLHAYKVPAAELETD